MKWIFQLIALLLVVIALCITNIIRFIWFLNLNKTYSYGEFTDIIKSFNNDTDVY